MGYYIAQSFAFKNWSSLTEKNRERQYKPLNSLKLLTLTGPWVYIIWGTSSSVWDLSVCVGEGELYLEYCGSSTKRWLDSSTESRYSDNGWQVAGSGTMAGSR